MKETSKLHGIGMRILLFGVAAALLTVLLSMAVSLLILRGRLPENLPELYSTVICAASVAITCFFACGKSDAGTMLTCLGVASVYFALVLLAKTILLPGAAEGLPERALSVYGAAVAAAFLMTLRRKGRGARRRTAHR